jgi:hypothetical protein
MIADKVAQTNKHHRDCFEVVTSSRLVPLQVLIAKCGLRDLQDDSLKNGRGLNTKPRCHFCQPLTGGWLLPGNWNIRERKNRKGAHVAAMRLKEKQVAITMPRVR